MHLERKFLFSKGEKMQFPSLLFSKICKSRLDNGPPIFLAVPSKYLSSLLLEKQFAPILYELYLLSALMKNKVDKCIVTRKALEKENPLKAPRGNPNLSHARNVHRKVDKKRNALKKKTILNSV